MQPGWCACLALPFVQPSLLDCRGFAVQHARKYHSSQTKYGRKAQSGARVLFCSNHSATLPLHCSLCASLDVGDTVKVRCDMDKKTLEFFINGQSLGVAFTDLTSPVVRAIFVQRSQSPTALARSDLHLAPRFAHSIPRCRSTAPTRPSCASRNKHGAQGDSETLSN